MYTISRVQQTNNNYKKITQQQQQRQQQQQGRDDTFNEYINSGDGAWFGEHCTIPRQFKLKRLKSVE